MNTLSQHIDEVIAPVPANRSARRAQQQADRRAARQQHRSRVRIERALSVYTKEAAA